MTNPFHLKDAGHNCWEACKEAILLEGHLRDEERRCADCIMKHAMALEALAKEGQNLGNSRRWKGWLANVASVASKVLQAYMRGGDPLELAERLRAVRKDVMPALAAVSAKAEEIAVPNFVEPQGRARLDIGDGVISSQRNHRGGQREEASRIDALERELATVSSPGLSVPPPPSEPTDTSGVPRLKKNRSAYREQRPTSAQRKRPLRVEDLERQLQEIVNA